MPYELITQNGKHCVAKKGGGVVPGGCHADEGKAKKHMAALYAAENKEAKELTAEQEEMITKELDEKHMDGVDSWVPGGVTSFKDLYAWRETQKETEEIRNTSSDFQSLVSNILWNSEISDKGPAIKTLTDEFSKLLAEDIKDVNTPEAAEDKSFKEKVREWFINMFSKSETEKAINGLMLWKEADGSWRWFARYSNKFRDRDNPPEIISSKSHIAFVEKVDKGLATYPQLWLWHRPEWKWGEGTWVGYDDTGFALAMGSVDKGYESLAESISKLDPKSIRVSHGMPKKSIVRDPDDPTVIIEHETVEISPLPDWAAANMLTSFTIFNKEDNMAIPSNKREELIKNWGIPADVLDELEKRNEAQAKEAAEKGIESKEAAQAAPVAPETPATDVPPSTAPAQLQKDSDPTPTPQASQTPTAEELAAAVSAVLNDRLTAIDQRFATLEAALTQANEELKALKETDEQKIIKAAKDIPAMSFQALLAQNVRSVIGASDAVVDGRSSLAKSKPEETKPPEEKRSGHPGIWVVEDIIKESEKPKS